MAILYTVFHLVLQQFASHPQILIQVSEHLAVPWCKDLIHILLGNVEKLGKFLVLGKAVYLFR